MGFDFPFGSKVVELASGQFSDVFTFSASVPTEASETFMRIIALWRDNQALGGEAPTIEIRSGQGGLTPLEVTLGIETRAVTIIGTGGTEAAKATCVREDADIFLVRIFDIDKNNGPWQLRIRNNDPQTLHFVAVSSTDPDQTAKPWLVWGAARDSFTTAGNPAELSIDLPGLFSTHAVMVRNLGTGPLRFAEQPGVSIGGPNSPAVITDLLSPVRPNDTPRQLAPHGIKEIVFGVHENGADENATVTHTAATNDPNPLHAVNLTIHVRRTNFPPPPLGGSCHLDHCGGYLPPPPYKPAFGATNSGPCIQPGCGHDADFHRPPPPPGAPCNLDHCPGYIPPPPYLPPPAISDSGPCIQPGCGHDSEFHGLGPRCQQGDNCPGFLDSNGRGRLRHGPNDAICVQPGCGHAWEPEHFHTEPHPIPRPCRECECINYVPRSPGDTGPCRRGVCGHPFSSHGRIKV